MIGNSDTHNFLRALSRQYAEESRAELVRHLPPLSLSEISDVQSALRDAYLRGADAGYTACVAERRKP